MAINMKADSSKTPPQSDLARAKAAAKANYDRLSPIYDGLASASERKYKELGLQKLRAQAGETILEIGFGTGQCLVTLAEAVGPSGQVYGIDLSAGMHKLAQARIEKAGLADRVHLICQDAIPLPYANQSLDAIFMSFTLELFDPREIPLLLQECRRVLRPAGRLGVVAMSKRGQPNLAVTLYEWTHEKFPHTVDCRPILVRQLLEQASFFISDLTEMFMFGLPVDVLVAQPK
jgi:demethylmenaquinone methyltransferase/2-methoxy-6-polyprenyl-1,4-benzoquinol methylase